MSATYCWSCSECLCHESNFVKKDETVFPDLQYFEVGFDYYSFINLFWFLF